jgi:hypothetical protein
MAAQMAAQTDWLVKIPAMSDIALANLLTNARRIIASGATSRQATAAAEILPSIKAEIAARKASVLAEAGSKPRARAKAAPAAP